MSGLPHEAEQFALDHAPGRMVITPSRWGALVLPPEQRPGWMPSAYALALHMLGKVPLEAEGPHLRRGKLMEPVGARLAVEDHGLEILGEQVRRERLDIPAVTYLDVITDKAPLELKTVNARDFEQHWNGTPPTHVRVQAQCQAAVTGAPCILVGAIVMGWNDIELKLFEEPRHDSLIDRLVNEAGDFFELLRRGELPPMDDSASSYDAWSAVVNFTEGKRILLDDPEAITFANKWKETKVIRGFANKTEDDCRRWFAQQVEDDVETIAFPDGTAIRRSRVERKGYFVEPTSFVSWRFSE